MKRGNKKKEGRGERSTLIKKAQIDQIEGFRETESSLSDSDLPQTERKKGNGESQEWYFEGN